MAAFSNRQCRELRKLIARCPEIVAGENSAENFLLRYVGFEAVARRCWHYYRCRKKTVKESRSGIPLSELIKACDNFEMGLGEDTIKLLLDSKSDRRNFKSARNLRNGIVHGWNEADCKEAKDRFNEFAQHFDAFFTALGSAL
jgi:hypothetical protein